ncbi:MAG: DNA repair protein RecO [Eubacteriales bacterium]|nr:DNA repair protein RecO [Eubacteriales bacterium]
MSSTLCLNGIVTNYTDYRDNDRILSLFTFEQGRVDVKARNCRKPTAPLLNCAQPFTYGEFELFYYKNKYTVNQFELKESFFPLREDFDRFSIAGMATQLCHDVVQPEQPNEELFSLLYHTLSFLSYGTSDPIDLAICFLVRYFNLIGYCPTITSCANCSRDLRGDRQIFFSAMRGGAICLACCQGEPHISKLALEAMRRMLLLLDVEMPSVVLKPELRKELLNVLVRYSDQVLGEGNRATSCLKQN